MAESEPNKALEIMEVSFSKPIPLREYEYAQMDLKALGQRRQQICSCPAQ